MSASSDEQKRAVAVAALEYVPVGGFIGVGTGSTAERFIEALAAGPTRVKGAVASSERTRGLLEAAGVPVVDLNRVGRLPVYIDGADEADADLRLIKGGGGALTREKICAAASELFVCIVDESKLVDRLGDMPVPLEVIPMGRVHVTRRVSRIGGDARVREGFVTDNGNEILDVAGLDLANPAAVERTLDGFTGVVANGLFARRPADVLLVGVSSGVERFERPRTAPDGEWP